MIMSFLDPRVWAAVALATALGYAGGYATHYLKTAKRDAAVEARQETTQQAATATVTAVDTAAIDALKSKLAASDRRAAALQARIEEYRRANPAPVDCRLPDGLRDAINHHLDPEGAQ
jgi:hypothetical protein